MKRLFIISLALVALAGCFSRRDEEQRREMTQWQVRVVQTELEGIGQSHQRLNTNLALLQSRLNDMNDELGRGDARRFAIGASNKYLLELHTQGFGPGAGRWVLENPAWPSQSLFLFAVVVVLCWVLYRVRLRSLEASDLAEVNRVIDQINRPAAASAPATLLAPAAPAPAPAQPKPAAPPVARPAPVPAPAPKKAKAPAAAAPTPAPAAPVPAPAATSASVPKPAEKPADKPAEKKAEAKPAKKVVSRRDSRRKTAARPAAKKCKVEGCPNKHRSKGYCNKHYQQWRKSGSPEGDENE